MMSRPSRETGDRHMLEINDLYITVYEKDSLIQSMDVSRTSSDSNGPGQSHWLAPLIRKRFTQSIDVPWDRLNMDHLSQFQSDVLIGLDEIPAGSTVTYGDLAGMIDRPGASRAVGQTLKKNPFPILLPCHRVIRSDGSVGGYGGKPDSSLKRHLLSLEGADLKDEP